MGNDSSVMFAETQHIWIVKRLRVQFIDVFMHLSLSRAQKPVVDILNLDWICWFGQLEIIETLLNPTPNTFLRIRKQFDLENSKCQQADFSESPKL